MTVPVPSEVDVLRSIIRAVRPEVMHPHMDGAHQFSCRGVGGTLTPEQWAAVYEIRDSDA